MLDSLKKVCKATFYAAGTMLFAGWAIRDAKELVNTVKELCGKKGA